MKIKQLIMGILALCFLGCQQAPKIKTEQIKSSEQTTIWNISIKRTTCSSTDIDLVKQLTPFNDEIQGLISGIQAVFQEQAKRQNAQFDSIGEKQPFPYELFITDSLFQADEQLISLRIESYQMLGGANGTTHFYGINYNVQTGKFLTPKEILNYENAEGINALLKEYLKDPDDCYSFAAPTIENFSALNLTPDSVEFTYGKYILGPGGCGPTIISIPKNRLSGMLK